MIPGHGKIPWRREWLPTPVFWPGELHGQRSLVGYIVHEVEKSRTQLNNFHSLTHSLTHVLGLENLMLKWPYYPKQSTD